MENGLRYPPMTRAELVSRAVRAFRRTVAAGSALDIDDLPEITRNYYSMVCEAILGDCFPHGLPWVYEEKRGTGQDSGARRRANDPLPNPVAARMAASGIGRMAEEAKDVAPVPAEGEDERFRQYCVASAAYRAHPDFPGAMAVLDAFEDFTREFICDRTVQTAVLAQVTDRILTHLAGQYGA